MSSVPTDAPLKPIPVAHKSDQTAITSAGIAMCVLGALFYCYEYYLRVAPSVMVPELKLAFGLSDAAFGHLAAFYYYAYTPMQIPVGIIMDRLGPRRVLTLACFLSAIGTYLFATTSVVYAAQLGRFLVGFGAAFAYVGVLKIARFWLPQKYFALMAGLCSTLGMLGAISGSVAMNHLVEMLGWKTALYYAAWAGVGLGTILWLVVRDRKRCQQKPGPSSFQTHVLQDADKPLSSLKNMFLSPQMWLVGLIGCLTFLPISGFAEIWAVSFLTTVGMSKHEAAVGSSMLFLGFACGGPLWGVVSDLLKSRRKPLMIGAGVSACFMALVILKPTTELWWMYSLLFCSTFFASAEILIFAVSNDLARNEVSATAAAFTNMVVTLGGVIIPPIIGKCLDLLAGSGSTTASVWLTTEDYAMAFWILPAGLALAGIFSFLLKESYSGYR